MFSCIPNENGYILSFVYCRALSRYIVELTEQGTETHLWHDMLTYWIYNQILFEPITFMFISNISDKFLYHYFRAVAEFLQPCQSKCQHTSCSACRFVTTPSCRKCKQDDFRCLKKFGKCVRKDTCSRRKFPCKEMYAKVSPIQCRYDSSFRDTDL